MNAHANSSPTTAGRLPLQTQRPAAFAFAFPFPFPFPAPVLELAALVVLPLGPESPSKLPLPALSLRFPLRLEGAGAFDWRWTSVGPKPGEIMGRVGRGPGFPGKKEAVTLRGLVADTKEAQAHDLTLGGISWKCNDRTGTIFELLR